MTYDKVLLEKSLGFAFVNAHVLGIELLIVCLIATLFYLTDLDDGA